MFDLHVLHAVKNAANYYKQDRARFDALFPSVGEAMRARLFAYLNDKTLNFEQAFSGKTAKPLPLISVELSEAYYDSQGIGNAAPSRYDEEGREIPYAHIFTSPEATVNIFANEIDGVRVLHRLVQAAMLLFHTSFINAGYQNLLFIGSTSLEPTEELTGEGLEVYGRQLRYAALHLLEIPAKIDTVISPLYDIQVASEEFISNSGVPGGVKVLSTNT